jgi:DNA-binding NtrC family response regulator
MTQDLLQPNAIPYQARGRNAQHMILGVGETPYAKAAEAHFSSQGWDVSVAKTAKDARKMALRINAAVVVLAADLGPESGWLSSVKLTRSRPNTRVILVGTQRTAELERFAKFAGAAAFVAETEGVCRLVKAVAGVDATCLN